MSVQSLTERMGYVRAEHNSLNRRALRDAAFVAAILFCLTPFASPPAALALGMFLALTLENPLPNISKQLSGMLLKACVVLLGFSMDLAVVWKAGKDGLLFAMGTIAGTLLLGVLVGRWLKIPPKTSALISAGTAICGGSAIAAVATVIGAAEGEVTVAMGTVFLLNAVALCFFPLIGHSLHMTQTQFGTWAGVSIHDISSVVGAASKYGLTALQTATAVKLSRALWIVPVSLGAAHLHRTSSGSLEKKKVQVPWFIGLFLLASVARTLFTSLAVGQACIAHIAAVGLTLTLFLIGAGLSRKTIQSVGWRPMAQGILLWIFISITALMIVRTWVA